MDYVAIFLIAALAAAIQAIVGFGYSLLFAPVAALFILPSDAVGTSIVTGASISVVLYAEHTPRAPLRPIAPMVLAALLAAPAGLWLLVAANEDILHILIGIGILVSAGINLRQHDAPHEARPDRIPLQLGVGVLSGLMRGAVSLPGPPVILYQHWVGGSGHCIRSQMFAFFVWTGIPTVGMGLLGGVFGPDVWRYAFAAGLGIPLGILAGRLMRGRTTDIVFSRLSMLLLAGTSVIAIVGALVNYV